MMICRIYFGLAQAQGRAIDTSYQPVIAIFAVASPDGALRCQVFAL